MTHNLSRRLQCWGQEQGTWVVDEAGMWVLCESVEMVLEEMECKPVVRGPD